MKRILLLWCFFLAAPGSLGAQEEKKAGGGDAADGAKQTGEVPLKIAGFEGLGFELGGYFRSRFYHSEKVPMDPLSSTADYLGKVEYLDTRLKLAPTIKYADVVKATMWLHILDDVVWGDNAGISSMGITASDPSSTNRVGDEVPLVSVKAAWIEMNLKAAVFMIGRMPSDWGLGLLTTGSEGLDDDFSWNRGGSIYDRVLVATEPVSLVLTLAKARHPRFPLIFAYCYDQLVEDDIGVGSTRLSYTSQWLADNADDVRSHNFVLEYKGDKIHLLTPEDRLEVGAYLVTRSQEATYSDLTILDYFWKLRLGPPHLYGFFEGEIYTIRGSTRAVPLGGHPDEAWCLEEGYQRCPDWLYTEKDVKISAWIFRLGVGWKPTSKLGLTFKLEAGFASGDRDPGSRTFTGMPAHPDLKVGLVLYDILLYELTRLNWTHNPGFWSGGGIYNSYYILAMAKVTLLDTFDILVQGLAAWPDRADGAVIQRPPPPDQDEREFMGFEFDAGVRARLYRNHALIGLEAGFLKAGPALERKDFQGREIYPELPWTIQFWAAYVI
jgi:hypothetical protein